MYKEESRERWKEEDEEKRRASQEPAKFDRLAKAGLKVLYWNCTNLSVKEAAAEKL